MILCILYILYIISLSLFSILSILYILYDYLNLYDNNQPVIEMRDAKTLLTM
jgi:hypothetical protein